MGTCGKSLKDEIVFNFSQKYPYLDQGEVEAIFFKAKSIYLSLSFPYHHEITEIPSDRPDAYRLIWMIMDEILERNGCSSAISYSENGLSITFNGDGLSSFLQSMIKGKCKAP